MEDLNDLFREEEDRLLATAREEISAIDAIWAALSQAERDVILAANKASLYDLPEDDEEDDEEDEDEDEDEDEEY